MFFLVFLVFGVNIYKCLSSHKLLWVQICGQSGLYWRAGWPSGSEYTDISIGAFA